MELKLGRLKAACKGQMELCRSPMGSSDWDQVFACFSLGRDITYAKTTDDIRLPRLLRRSAGRASTTKERP